VADVQRCYSARQFVRRHPLAGLFKRYDTPLKKCFSLLHNYLIQHSAAGGTAERRSSVYVAGWT